LKKKKTPSPWGDVKRRKHVEKKKKGFGRIESPTQNTREFGMVTLGRLLTKNER